MAKRRPWQSLPFQSGSSKNAEKHITREHDRTLATKRKDVVADAELSRQPTAQELANMDEEAL